MQEAGLVMDVLPCRPTIKAEHATCGCIKCSFNFQSVLQQWGMISTTLNMQDCLKLNDFTETTTNVGQGHRLKIHFNSQTL